MKYVKLDIPDDGQEKMFFKNDNNNLIGYLRGDFGKNGNEFWVTWFSINNELNTEEFSEDITKTIDILRDDSILASYSNMSKVCFECSKSKLHLGDGYGFIYESENYSYYIRAITNIGDYNFYIFCYDKTI